MEKNADMICYQKNTDTFLWSAFFETDYKKTSSGPSMGTRVFDLTALLNTNKLPELGKIAEQLREKTWN